MRQVLPQSKQGREREQGKHGMMLGLARIGRERGSGLGDTHQMPLPP